MTTVIVTEKALRELLREAMWNAELSGWSSNHDAPANVNSNVDPSIAVTDPVNPNFTPKNKTEFGVAINQLVKDLPDTEMPGLFDVVKDTIDRNEKAEDEEEMTNKAAQGGTKQVEETVRKSIRSVLASMLQEARPTKEFGPVTGPLPPVKKIPAGVHGGEYNRRIEKNISDLKKGMGKAIDAYEAPPASEPDAPEAEAPAEPARRRTYKDTALGDMSDVGGKSFEQIATELGFSVAGAKQAVDKALDKARFVHNLGEKDEEGLEIMTIGAFNDYVKYLTKSGELTPADIQLMKDHPEIVQGLDGFREFFHNYIRRARKAAGLKVIDPVRDEDSSEEPVDLDAGSDEEAAPETPVPPTAKSVAPPAAPTSGKAYKIYPGGKGKPPVTRFKGKVYSAKQDTQFKPNEQGVVSSDGDKIRVKKPDSDHTQTWDPVGESRQRRPVLVSESTAAKVAERKKARPDLYCSKCLWMTGGGNCPRHGGPAWSKEREQAARAKSRGEEPTG